MNRQSTNGSDTPLDSLVHLALQSESSHQFSHRAQKEGALQALFESSGQMIPREATETMGGMLARSFWRQVPRPELDMRTPAEADTTDDTRQGHGDSNIIQLDEYRDAGRNDPCPCGSGKKYKKCCQREVEERKRNRQHRQAEPDLSPPDEGAGSPFDEEDVQLFGRIGLSRLSEDELLYLADRENLTRSALVVDELVERALWKPARRLLKSNFRDGPLLAGNGPDVEEFLYVTLKADGVSAFLNTVEQLSPRAEEEGAFVLAVASSFRNASVDDDSDNPASSDALPDTVSEEQPPILDRCLTIIRILSDLLRDRPEDARSRTDSLLGRYPEFDTRDEDPPSFSSQRDRWVHAVESFDRQFLRAVSERPELMGRLVPEQLTAEMVLPNSMGGYDLLYYHIPQPDETPFSVVNAGDRDWCFDRSSEQEQFLWDRADRNDRSPAELSNRLKERPHDLGLLIDYIDALLEHGFRTVAFDLLDRGIALGEAAFPDSFESGTDRLPWGFHENRPFLRLKDTRMQIYFLENALERTQREALELLNLNPSDNTGARETAIGVSLYLNDQETALEIADRFPDDVLPGTLYGSALALYQLGRKKEGEEVLKKAFNYTPNVATALLEGPLEESDEMTSPFGDGVLMGGAQQANMYRETWGELWETTPGALDWLASVYDRHGGEQ